jgi:isopenicillin N synthase-like dioxygenase
MSESGKGKKGGNKRAKAENGEPKVVEATKEEVVAAKEDAKVDEDVKGDKRATKANARKGSKKAKESKEPSRRSARGQAKAEAEANGEDADVAEADGDDEEKPKKSKAKAKSKSKAKSKAKAKGKASKDKEDDSTEPKAEAEKTEATDKAEAEAEAETEGEKKPAKGKAKSKAKAKAKSKAKGGKKESETEDGEAKETKVDRETERAEEMEKFPQIDLAKYLNKKNKKAWQKDCKTITETLKQYGFLIVKDPRVTMANNDTFIDTLERYYGQAEEKKAPDVRKDLHYQVGITPEKTERARDHCSRVAKLSPDEKPLTICPPELDNKLRFFWRIGDRPAVTEFKQLNAEPVVPAAFPDWASVMNTWGNLIMQTVRTVSEMAAEGFKLPKDTFTKLMENGPHLLAPTGSDFNKYGSLGTVLASYHYDLNFLTIHGRSRFPGLFIWTRDGKKLQVKVPAGCLLLQAGKQFEWLTGGEVLAGFHEVVVVPDTVAAIDKAKKEGRSLWRVSSTLFGHIASDNTLEPLPKFAEGLDKETKDKYPSVKAGTQVQQELNMIKLGQGEIATM